jgi:Flp pilus assembly protein TadB
MDIPLALALTLGAFVFTLLLAVDALFDRASRIRYRQTFDLLPEKYSASWKETLFSALQALRTPAFLEAWVTQQDLHWAGITLGVATYLALWWLLILLGLGLGIGIVFWVGWRGLGLGLALLVMIGMVGSPYLFLRWRIRRRARDITKSLPDLLDLLSFTVQAGLGFTPALQRVSVGYPGPLGDELRRLLEQIRLGYTRSQALDEFASRSPSSEILNFVEAVKLTEQLGTSLARTLRIQAHILRLARRQRAQAAAQTAPIRIVPALVFFFLPGLLLIYLAPPIINFFLRK